MNRRPKRETPIRSERKTIQQITFSSCFCSLGEEEITLEELKGTYAAGE